MLGIETHRTSSPGGRPLVSVVAPVFNESSNIDALLARLTGVLSQAGVDYEIVCVDDGSSDDSLDRLRAKAAADPHVKVIALSRNFGHQVAITTGMEYAKGDAIVIIDADLQDPPELIPQMIERWKEGFDVVFAVRRHRKGETALKLATASVFYRLIRRMTRISIPVDTGDFRLMSRRVVQVFLAMPESRRFVRGMVSWIGFRQTGIEYDRDERLHGETKYTYAKMLRFAMDGVTSFSYVPLQLASYLGFAAAAVGFLLLLFFIGERLFTNETIRGWTSTVVITLFLGGIQLLMIGVLGEYIGRIHSELKRRPLYIVKETINTGGGAA